MLAYASKLPIGYFPTFMNGIGAPASIEVGSAPFHFSALIFSTSIRRNPRTSLFCASRVHVRIGKREIPHIDVDDLGVVERELLSQRRVDIGGNPGPLCDRIGSVVLRGHGLEDLLRGGLNVGRKVAVVGILLEHLRHAVGTDAVPNRHA